MRREIALILTLLVLIVSLPLLYPGLDSFKVKASNGGPVHNIMTGQNYTTIQGAINDASYGDSILVESGIYNEDVVVNQTVSLMGGDRHTTIVNGSGNAPVFYIRRDDVVVSNFTMQNNNMFTWAGVYFGSYSSNSNVSRNIIRNCSVGVRCWEYSEGNFIVDNEIANCRTGVKDRYSSGNFIIGNNISLCSEYGVDVEGSEDTVVQGNTISQCWGGIFLSFGSRRTVIHDNYISNGDGGIGLDASSRNIITNNRIEHCNLSGMFLGEALWTGSNYNTVTNNTISFATKGEGLFIYGSTGNNLSDNTMLNNLYNFGVEGEELSDFIHSIDTSNTVDGKPIYYWINELDVAVPLDAGYVGLVNSTRITVQTLDLTNNRQGILLAFTSDSTITGNNLTSNYYGINVWNSSDYNTLYDNRIEQNEYGVWLGFCSNNRFYHNNFTDNSAQVHIDSPGYPNFWNETYPIGGNYWSDFKDVYPLVEDSQSGEYPQSEPSGDGIWDGPYEINEDNIDYYPIVPEFPSLLILPLFLIATLLAVILYKRKHSM
jgi:parallel beta-helix repeat protein